MPLTAGADHATPATAAAAAALLSASRRSIRRFTPSSASGAVSFGLSSTISSLPITTHAGLPSYQWRFDCQRLWSKELACMIRGAGVPGPNPSLQYRQDCAERERMATVWCARSTASLESLDLRGVSERAARSLQLQRSEVSQPKLRAGLLPAERISDQTPPMIDAGWTVGTTRAMHDHRVAFRGPDTNLIHETDR